MANVVCVLNVEAERATFTWSEGPASFEPYKLEGMVYKDFKEIAAEAREKLAELVRDYLQDDAHVPAAAFALAEAGYELYQAIFQPGAEGARQAKQVRKWLEKLAEQQEVDTLEVVVESPWSLPWNIVYDRPPVKSQFLAADAKLDHWRPFWGLRYNLAGGRKVDPLRRMPLLVQPHVLMVVDPEIQAGLPEDQRQRLAAFVAKHGLQVAGKLDALQEAIAAKRPDILYWLSHAEPDALVLGGESISPRNLRKLLRQDDEEHFGGLAFLNACQTAEGGESGSFFEAFHSVGFAGMIGTEHQTIDQFANPLGLDFLEAFLERGEPVGEVLRRLRGQVPLGLLYGLYCPPEIRVERAAAADTLDIRHVKVEGVSLGVSAPQRRAASGGLARLPSPTTAAGASAVAPLPAEPYRSLAFYDRQDRALLAGRDADVERFARLLDDPAVRLVVLHGESGVGKSSFLRAGAIPFLEEDCRGFQFARDRAAGTDQANSILFVRATNDLFGQLAQALCTFCARPYEYVTPTGKTVRGDLPGALREFAGEHVDPGKVRSRLRKDPAALGRLLDAISACLPFSLLLIIDQGEEVHTLAQTAAEQRLGRQALDMLRHALDASGDFRVIFCLRTEYYGRVIDRLRRGTSNTNKIREYLLTDFDERGLLEAIRRPTAEAPIPHASEVPFAKYGFRYAAGVAEEISRRICGHTIQRRDSVLPLMQVICGQLFRLASQRADKTIRLDDLERLGGVDGGMRSHVDGLLNELLQGRPLDRQPVQRLFTQLYLKQPDGTLTTALLSEDEVRRRWTGRMPFDEFLSAAQNLRLLKVNSLRIGDDQERRFVSLGHDALAKIAAEWDERLGRAARLRKMFAALAAVSAVAAALALLTMYAFAQRHQAVASQREAKERFRETRRMVDKWYTGVGVGLKDLPYVDHVRTRLLKEAAEDYSRFATAPSADPELRVEAARAFVRLGELHRELGDRTAAESAFRSAIAAFETLRREAPDVGSHAADLARSQVQLAVSLADGTDRDEAARQFATALRSLAALVESRPKVAEFRAARADALYDYARLQRTSGDAAAALKSLEQAADDFTQLSLRGEARDRQGLAVTQQERAQTLVELGRNDEALRLHGEAVELWEKLVAEDGAERAYQDGLAGARLDRAANWLALGRLSEARDEYERSFADYQALLEVFGPVRRYRDNVARAKTNLGLFLHQIGDEQQAASLLLDALKEFTDLAKRYPQFPTYREAAAVTQTAFAEVANDLGQSDLARQGLEGAIDQWNSLIVDYPDRPSFRERRGESRSRLGRALHQQGELEAAGESLRGARDELTGDGPFARDLRAQTLTYLGDLLRDLGRADDALAVHREAVEIRESLTGPSRAYSLAWLLTHGRDEKLRRPQRAAEIARGLTAENPENGSYWGIYGAALYRRAAAQASLDEESRKTLATAVDCLKKAAMLRPHPDSADWFVLAMTHHRLGSSDEAAQSYAQALEVLQATRPGNWDRQLLNQEAAELLGVTPEPSPTGGPSEDAK